MDLYSHKEAIICGDKRFTYGQFGERCEKFASALTMAGVEQDDRIAFLSFNTHKLLEGYYAVPQARGMVMPLNVRLTPPELGNILVHSEAKMLFYENDFAPLVTHLKTVWPKMRTINLDTEYEEFIAAGKAEHADICSYDENSIAELFYTSGSTGTPKGVMLGHRTVYMHAMAVAGTFKAEDSGVELHTIPLFHANGWGRPQTATMMGQTQVMVRRFEPFGVCNLIQKEGATTMLLVPTMAAALLSVPNLSEFNFSSLTQIFIGGAAASAHLIEKMEKAFGCEVLAGYGLTETCPVATSARRKSTITYRDEADRYLHQSMAGWPLPGTEVRVVDDKMHDVPRDMTAIGEIIIAGDNVMDGYYNEPEATAAVMTGPWFHTGDMAIWDTEGYVHIVDRKKDIIISGGENISSIEVENMLASHPAVAEAAVVGAPDPVWGEIPVAFIVLKPGAECTAKDLMEFSTTRLAKFKLPRLFEFLSEPLPKGGTGKVLKRELRDKFWHGKERKVQGIG
jgi:fatty-acyl-CoA synthase